MVGEMRDTETARIAVQSALTGHIVLSTPWNAGSKTRRCGPGSTGCCWLYPCSGT